MHISTDAPPVFITLVHGTFAGEALWTREGSVMWRALNNEFGRDAICRIDWGRWNNSHPARIHGAAILRRHIDELLDKYPRSRHILVGHSHGGNVILYALSEERIRDAVVGVFCVGTPFLRCNSRRVDYMLGCAGILVVLSLFLKPLSVFIAGGVQEWANLILIPSFNLLTHKDYFDYFLLSPLNIALKLVLEICYMVGLWFVFSITRDAFGAARAAAYDRAQAIARTYAFPKFDKTPVRCYRVSRDESRLLLRAATRLDDIPTNAFSAPPVLLVTAIIAVALAVRTVILRPRFGTPLSDVGYLWSFPLEVLWHAALTVDLVMVAVLLVLTIVTVVRDQPLGYGWQMPGFTWLVRIFATDAPDDLPLHSTTKTYPRNMFIQRFGLLRCLFAPLHSLIHDHPQVAADLAKDAAELAKLCSRRELEN
jgi:hypothetical protein